MITWNVPEENLKWQQKENNVLKIGNINMISQRRQKSDTSV